MYLLFIIYLSFEAWFCLYIYIYIYVCVCVCVCACACACVCVCLCAYLPTPPHGQDVTQGHFLNGVD